MGNKYGSNIRTYTARNLVWNCTPVQPVPFAMASPANLVLDSSGSANDSFVKSFYRAQVAGITDWNPHSRLSIKRVGLFCNFADGLVQQMDKSRIKMTITAALYSLSTQPVANTIRFYNGSNEVTGPTLDVDVSAGDIVYDTTNDEPYFIQSAAVSAGDPAYLTDYHVSPNTADLSIANLTSVNSKDFAITNIATLNTMYEAEIFFPYTKGVGEYVFLSCELSLLGGTQFNFYTKSIDPLFNTLPVSFDSVIEVEVTPV